MNFQDFDFKNYKFVSTFDDFTICTISIPNNMTNRLEFSAFVVKGVLPPIEHPGVSQGQWNKMTLGEKLEKGQYRELNWIQSFMFYDNISYHDTEGKVEVMRAEQRVRAPVCFELRKFWETVEKENTAVYCTLAAGLALKQLLNQKISVDVRAEVKIEAAADAAPIHDIEGKPVVRAETFTVVQENEDIAEAIKNMEIGELITKKFCNKCGRLRTYCKCMIEVEGQMFNGLAETVAPKLPIYQRADVLVGQAEASLEQANDHLRHVTQNVLGVTQQAKDFLKHTQGQVDGLFEQLKSMLEKLFPNRFDATTSVKWTAWLWDVARAHRDNDWELFVSCLVRFLAEVGIAGIAVSAFATFSRTLRPNQPKADLEVEGQGFFDAVPIVFAAVGTCVLQRFPQVVEMKKAMEFCRTFNVAVPTAKNVGVIVSTIPEWLPTCVNSFIGMLCPAYAWKIFLGGGFRAFHEAVDKLTVRENQMRIKYDVVLQKQLETLKQQALSYIHEVVNMPQVSPKLAAYFHEDVKKIDKFIDIMNAAKGQRTIRKVPFVVCLYGPPNTGKSLLSIALAYLIRKSEGDENLIYSKSSADEFWSGYTGQETVLMDDMFAFDDEALTQTFLTAISNVNLPLNMPSVDDPYVGVKGTPLSSDNIIYSTNILFPKPSGLQLPEALWRRRNLAIEVTVKAQYCENKRPVYSRIPAEVNEAMGYLNFRLHDPVHASDGAFLDNGRYYTFEEICQVILEAKISHEKNQEYIVSKVKFNPIVERIRTASLVVPAHEVMAQMYQDEIMFDPILPGDKKVVMKIEKAPSVCANECLHVMCRINRGVATKTKSWWSTVKKELNERIASFHKDHPWILGLLTLVATGGIFMIGSQMMLGLMVSKPVRQQAERFLPSFYVRYDRWKELIEPCLLHDGSGMCTFCEKEECTWNNPCEKGRVWLEDQYEYWSFTTRFNNPWATYAIGQAAAGKGYEPKQRVKNAGLPRRITQVKAQGYERAEIDRTATELVTDAIEPKMSLWMKDKTYVSAFQFGGTYFLVPRHFVTVDGEYLPHGTEIQIHFGRDVSYTIAFDANHVSPLAGGRDVVVYDAGPRIQAAPNRVKHFFKLEDLPLIENKPGVMIALKPNDGSLDYIHYNFRRTELQSELRHYKVRDTDYYLLNAFVYDAATQVGDCGGLVCSYGKGVVRRLLGIHVAGRDMIGMAEPVTQEDLLPYLKAITGMVEPPSFVNTEEEIHRVVPQGNFTFVGAVPGPYQMRAPSKTAIRESAYFGAFGKAKTEPSVLVPTDDRLCEAEFGKSLLVKGIEKYAIQAKPMNERMLDIAHNSLVEIWGDAKKPNQVHDWHVAINGIPGSKYIHGMDMSTSPGHPYKLRREIKVKRDLFDGEPGDWHVKDAMLRERWMRRVTLAEQGERLEDSVWVDNTKDERRPLEKIILGKTRIFATPSVDFSLVMRQYHLDFFAEMYESYHYSYSAVGMDPESDDWHEMVAYLMDNSSVGFAGDFGRFDGTLQPQCVHRFAECANEFYNDDEVNQTVRKVLWDEIIHPIHIAADCAYVVHGGNPSGNPATVLVNTYVNALYILYVWMLLAPIHLKNIVGFARFVRMKIYGDDNIVSVKQEALDWFNMRTVSAELEKMGIEYTAPTKDREDKFEWRNLTDFTFLKRSIVRCPDILSMKYFAAIDNVVITEMIMWIRKSEDPIKAVEANINTALLFALFHGKLYFNYVKKVVMQWAKKRGLRVPAMYTYHDLVIQYREGKCVKPVWEEVEGQMYEDEDEEIAEVEYLCRKATHMEHFVQLFGRVDEERVLTNPHAWQVTRCRSPLCGRCSLPMSMCVCVPEEVEGQMMPAPAGPTQLLAGSVSSSGGGGEPAIGGAAVAVIESKLGVTMIDQQETVVEHASEGGGRNDQQTRAEAMMPDKNWTIHDMVGRKIPFETVVWSTTNSELATLAQWQLPQELWVTNTMSQPFRTFTFWRGMIEIEAKLNGTPMQQGLLCLHYQPLLRKSTALNWHCGNKAAMTSVQHIFLDPSSNTPGQLIIPFTNTQSFLNLATPRDGIDFTGCLNLSVFNQLHATQASTQVDVTLFVTFQEPKFHVPKPIGFSRLEVGPIVKFANEINARNTNDKLTEMEKRVVRAAKILETLKDFGVDGEWENIPEEVEGQMGSSHSTTNNDTTVVQSYNVTPGNGNSAATVDKALKNTTAPEPRGVFGPVNIGVSSTNSASTDISPKTDVDASEGMDKPTFGINPIAIRKHAVGYLNHAKTLEMLDRFDLVANSINMVDHEHFGTMQDEMNLAYLMRKMTYHIKGADPGDQTPTLWHSTDVVGTILLQGVICPFAQSLNWNCNPSQKRYIDNLSFVANHFSYWQGSLEIRIDVIGTGFHSGRLAAIPHYGVTSPPATLSEALDQNATYFDFNAQNRSFTFKMPYHYVTEWCKMPHGPTTDVAAFAIGVWTLRVVNALKMPDSVSNFVEINQFRRAGEDFKVWGLFNNNATLVPIQGQMGDMSLTQPSADKTTDAVVSTTGGLGIKTSQHFGSEHTHLREAMKRWTSIGMISDYVAKPIGAIVETNAIARYAQAAFFIRPQDVLQKGLMRWYGSCYRLWRGSIRIKMVSNQDSIGLKEPDASLVSTNLENRVLLQWTPSVLPMASNPTFEVYKATCAALIGYRLDGSFAPAHLWPLILDESLVKPGKTNSRSVHVDAFQTMVAAVSPPASISEKYAADQAIEIPFTSEYNALYSLVEKFDNLCTTDPALYDHGQLHVSILGTPYVNQSITASTPSLAVNCPSFTTYAAIGDDFRFGLWLGPHAVAMQPVHDVAGAMYYPLFGDTYTPVAE